MKRVFLIAISLLFLPAQSALACQFGPALAQIKPASFPSGAAPQMGGFICIRWTAIKDMVVEG